MRHVRSDGASDGTGLPYGNPHPNGWAPVTTDAHATHPRLLPILYGSRHEPYWRTLGTTGPDPRRRRDACRPQSLPPRDRNLMGLFSKEKPKRVLLRTGKELACLTCGF